MTECNFCKKYNMSVEDFKRAVRDGRISTTVMAHDEIYSEFKRELSMSGNMAKSIAIVSVKRGISERTIYTIVKEFS